MSDKAARARPAKGGVVRGGGGARGALGRAPWWLLVVSAGCAGVERDCASSCAGATGADWIIVQYRADGEVINCWKLHNTSVSNEPHSDGVYWQDPANGNLVHISGWYNRVQVQGGAYDAAAASIGVDAARCSTGRYRSNQAPSAAPPASR